MKSYFKSYRGYYWAIIFLSIIFTLILSQEFTSCIQWHSLNDSPNFCGVVEVMLLAPILLFDFVLTILFIIRRYNEKKGKVILSGYLFWLFAIIITIVSLILLLLLGVLIPGGLSSLLR